MLRKTATVAVAAALGGAAAFGIAACGEDRSGDVNFQNDTATSTTPGPMPGAPTPPATETTLTGELPPETTTSP